MVLTGVIPGRVVMGGDSKLRGFGFNSQHWVHDANRYR